MPARRKSSDGSAVTPEARLWQEISQQLDLRQSLRHLTGILAEHFALDALVLRRLDADPPRLTTAGVELRTRAAPGYPWPTRSDLSAAQERDLTRFLTRAQPLLVHAPGDALASTVAPEGLAGAVLAGPLAVARKPVGVALLVLSPGVRGTARDTDKLQRFLPPLAVALENDQRLHELARMREAIEAEQAVDPVQRKEISDVIIGATGGLRDVMRRVAQVAPTDAPVLLLGETGSGKEVIARAIHARSRRASGPVVRVNCGAIPPELVDSELFGHERGAFTGATGTRKGWFERADGGTLFLDEVGELPLAAQVRLLRVLQDGTLERVGGHQSVTVDVRIVAATHRNLEAMVAARSFREDLWYRLSVFPLRLPPLRERMEDLPALAAYFAQHAGQRVGVAHLAPTEQDLELLRRYAWPGNVRELAAVLERAAILGNGRRLEVAAALGAALIPPPHSTPAGHREHAAPPRAAAPAPAEPSSLATLDEAMAAHITLALRACHGRIEGRFGAARLLGINPHTLRARMRKLKIPWATYRAAGGA